MATQKITFTNKRSGDLWTSNNANEVKDVVNNNADELSALAAAQASILERMTQGGTVSQTETSVVVDPGVLNQWASPVASLSVGFSGVANYGSHEYMLEFTVSGDAFTLTLPTGIRWIEELDFEDGYTYQVSVLNGLAVGAGWEPAATEEEEEEGNE